MKLCLQITVKPRFNAETQNQQTSRESFPRRESHQWQQANEFILPKSQSKMASKSQGILDFLAWNQKKKEAKQESLTLTHYLTIIRIYYSQHPTDMFQEH